MLLLGAGASVKSGVPAAGDLVHMAGKWAWCREHGRAFDDQTVTASDWRPWLHSQDWFNAAVNPAELYPVAVERLLHPRESRRRFFLNALRPVSGEASEGYAALARLLAARTVLTVLTVNFDGLVARAAHADRTLTHLTEIHGPEDIEQFSLAPAFPQVVEVHGSVQRYHDCNLERETQHLDRRLREPMWPLLRDHPLVVVGYRGAEPSVMVDLLLDGAEQSMAFRHGLYWCVRPGDDDLHPHVLALAERLGSNFTLVEIAGFDQVLVEWASGASPAQPPPWSAGQAPDVPDLRPSETRLEDLDLDLLRRRHAEYVRRLGDAAPVDAVGDWEALKRHALGTSPSRSSTRLAASRGEQTCTSTTLASSVCPSTTYARTTSTSCSRASRRRSPPTARASHCAANPCRTTRNAISRT